VDQEWLEVIVPVHAGKSNANLSQEDKDDAVAGDCHRYYSCGTMSTKKHHAFSGQSLKFFLMALP
jgi:hypothetical protein